MKSWKSSTKDGAVDNNQATTLDNSTLPDLPHVNYFDTIKNKETFGSERDSDSDPELPLFKYADSSDSDLETPPRKRRVPTPVEISSDEDLEQSMIEVEQQISLEMSDSD